MLRKVKDLTDEEIIKILEERDCKCKYCPFETIEKRNGDTVDCPKNIKCYGGEPIYPFCEEDEDKVHEGIIDNFRDQVEEIEA